MTMSIALLADEIAHRWNIGGVTGEAEAADPTDLTSGQTISIVIPIRSPLPLATVNPLRAIHAPTQGDYIQNNKQSEYNEYCEHDRLLVCNCLLFIDAASSVLVGFYSRIVP